MGVHPTGCVMAIGEGLVFKTLKPLRCLGLSFTSLTSGKCLSNPKDTFNRNTKHLQLSDLHCNYSKTSEKCQCI